MFLSVLSGGASAFFPEDPVEVAAVLDETASGGYYSGKKQICRKRRKKERT